jgi:general secretion pathway protein A
LYLEYWGLKEKPFEITPDPKFFYSSKMHSEALSRVVYAITNNKGCALLSGEYGCGKTALVRKVIEALDPEVYELALVNYPIFSADEFLREVLFQYGVDTSGGGTKLEMFHRFSTFGYENLKKNKQNVLIIDEAQLIEDAEIYEQMRLMLNLQLEDKGVFSILLVGQPEVRERVLAYPQLDQRVSIRYHLHYFSHDDVVAYIRHRLRIAGVMRELFSAEAYVAITRASHGVPRRINNICDLCLLDGLASRAQIIDDVSVKRVQ